MSEQPSTHQAMEKIRFVFQHALQFSSSNDDPAVDAYLNNIDPRFRAVAYEGVAMSVASKDLHNQGLMKWRTFMRRTDAPYVPHVHVGLGWAIAKQNLSSLLFLESMRPSMLFRVLDGHGYYDGIFRPVKTIKDQSRHDSIKPVYFAAYDQGVGRCLWYSAKGDVDLVGEVVREFSRDRHAALWRGVGVAAAFVGGCDENILENLMANAEANVNHLGFGAALGIKARVATDSVGADTILTSRILCNISVDRVNELIAGIESLSDEDTYPLFMTRVSQIETRLRMKAKAAGVHKEIE